MRKYNRNVWWRRASREWKRNSDSYLIQFFLIIFIGAYLFAISVVGMN